ncbi:MAG: DUF3332 domain-containing protein [Altibacter sp.]|nr:DUF3332 domain-containing protein [Altibacter sp.]
MRKLIMCGALASSVLFSSCLGSFSAFNNLKDWNNDLSDSKFVNNLVFWGLNIIPVYSLFFVGDVLIFNVIEFWSGSNPIAMAEGEYETQIVEHKGTKLEMKASKNRFEIEILDGKRKGERVDLVYKPSEKSWNAVKQNGELIKLSSVEEGLIVYHLPNGEQIKLDPTTPREEGLAKINKEIYDYREGMTAVGN